MKRFWLIVAVVLGAVAVVCMWRGNFDAAFVTAVLACVAWFLNFRTQVKAINTARDAEEENERLQANNGVRNLDDVE